ncbi:MAG: response regulator, partial [Chloroflexota bacterium]
MVMVEEQTLSILVVEDDEDTAEVVCTLLEDAGYQAQAVERGHAALEAIERQSPDLVLLDLNLPDINGLEILRTVRANSFLP